MTGRERVRRALRFEAPDRVPRDLWALPGAQERYREEIRQLLERFPTDFAAPRFAYGPARRAAGTPQPRGTLYGRVGLRLGGETGRDHRRGQGAGPQGLVGPSRSGAAL
ncbi:MAG: hypothetical protein KatS3mg115_2194 [Candidatus Poribacteria bacterium]|nr:MAG: hypothetical protein KatS3mg115_2194 [Candidatus Poribacteria bacterium]